MASVRSSLPGETGFSTGLVAGLPALPEESRLVVELAAVVLAQVSADGAREMLDRRGADGRNSLEESRPAVLNRLVCKNVSQANRGADPKEAARFPDNREFRQCLEADQMRGRSEALFHPHQEIGASGQNLAVRSVDVSRVPGPHRDPGVAHTQRLVSARFPP